MKNTITPTKRKLWLFSTLLLLLVAGNLQAQTIIADPSASCGGTVGARLMYFVGTSCDLVQWSVQYPDGSYSNYTSFGTNYVYFPAGNQTGYINITASASCQDGNGPYTSYQTAYTEVVATRLAKPTFSSAPSTLCNNVAKTYSVNAVSNAVSYTWNVPSGWKINGVVRTYFTTTSTSVTVAAPSSGSSSGNVRVRANASSSGCNLNSYYQSKSVSYGVQNLSLLGPSSVKAGSINTFSASGSGLSNYNWSIPTFWSFSGSSTNSTARIISGSNSGYVSVNAQSCGSLVVDTKYVTISSSGSGQIPRSADNPDLITIDLDATVYPNPAAGQAKISLNAGQMIEEITIYDQLQRVVYSAKPGQNQHQLDLTTYENGVYYIQLSNGQRTITKTLIVQ